MHNKFQPFPIIKGKRLILEQLNKHHAKAIFEYQSDKANFPYTEMPVYTELSQAENYIEKMNAGVAENKWIVWAICLAETDTIIGTISIWNLNDEENKAEFGYGTFPKYRQNGYMREALELTKTYGFETMGLDYIEAYTFYKNEPSISLLKKMKFEYVKTFEDEYCDGTLMDLYKVYPS